MSHLYTYFVTSAPGGATQGALRCRLAKGSDREYLVCLKKSRIDVYSLEKVGELPPEGDGSPESDAPVLTATIEAHTNLLTIVEYKPPGADQSHLLALTCNLLLVLLTFDAEASRFVSKSLISLQEPGAQEIESDVLLRIDPEYHLIWFHGQKKTIKCIILDRDNYFNINHVITMRTGETVFLDVAFFDVSERIASGPPLPRKEEGASSSSAQRAAAIAALTAPCQPTSKQVKTVLECKLLLLASQTGHGHFLDDGEITGLWYCGIRLFFEIERCEGERHFNSYGCLPLFADPVALPKRYIRFLPLKLNPGPRTSDSVMLLGCQGLGFISFCEPRNVRLFHTDVSVGEICCYCTIEENLRYLIADDTGALYLLELVQSQMSANSALKRRVGRSYSSLPARKGTSGATYNAIVDVVTTRIGVYSPPSSLVMIAPNLVYIAAVVGNCRTVRLTGLCEAGGRGTQPVSDVAMDPQRETSGNHSDPSQLAARSVTASGPMATSDVSMDSGNNTPGDEYVDPIDEDFLTMDEDEEDYLEKCPVVASETWKQTNLGPILDFTFGPQRDYGSVPILACCGYGPDGRVCSITNGVGIDIFASHAIEGVRTIFTIGIQSKTDTNVIMCCGFFNYSRFYKVNVPTLETSPGSNRTAIDLVEQPTWIVTPVSGESYGLLESARTILLTQYGDNQVLQVTTSGLSLVNTTGTNEPSVFYSVDDICKAAQIECNDVTFPVTIVEVNNCDCGLFLLLSTHFTLLLDLSNGLKVIKSRRLSKQTSGTAYLSGADFRKPRKTGLIALSSWEDTEIALMSTETLDILHRTKVLCGYGVVILAVRFGVIGDTAFVFASMSDGTLAVHRVTFGDCGETYPDIGGYVGLILENIIKVSEGPIGLSTVVMSSSKGIGSSSSLTRTRVITTGDNPMLIYSNRGKLDYVPVNVPRIETITNIGAVASRSANGVPLLFTGKSQLSIGELDTISQLHVETIFSGRSFDKICYHHETDLIVVSCLGELVANVDGTGHLRGMDRHDNTVFRCMDSSSAVYIPGVYKLDSCAKFISLKTREVVHTLKLPSRHIISSMCTVPFDGPRTMIAMGTSLLSDRDEVPRQGHIFIVDIVNKGMDKWNVVFLRTVNPLPAGVVEMSPCCNALVVALNDAVTVLALRRDDTPATSHSHGHSSVKTYKLDLLHESDRSYGSYSLVTRAEYKSCSYIISLDVHKDVIVAADLVNSMRMLRWRGNELREVCKDFNSVYCTAAAAIDKTRCVISDSSGNFYVFSKRGAATNDIEALKAEEVGIFHHGENINRIRANPVTERVAPKLDITNTDHEMPEFPTKTFCTRRFCCMQGDMPTSVPHSKCGDLIRGLARPNKFWNYEFTSILTCVTSTGSLLQLCLFEDSRLFYRLALIEEAINGVQSSIGNISNVHWRSFKNRWKMSPPRGFIDGDVIESYGDLDNTLKNHVFDVVSRRESHGLFYSPELMALEIEHIRRLRSGC
ncbi:DNA damage-binding 1 [Babesia ovis]|uniref:DNA damage-binding 1 n=1 Tax=Babesia ovis TaxID=5869 RepID=A0A9W5TAC2_BABOV|nr:DNA damage-binding 1 [Babesia ovis]